jgi:hypothetical protein
MPNLIFQSLLKHCTLITRNGVVGEASGEFFYKVTGQDFHGKETEFQTVAVEELGWWALQPTQSGTFLVGVRKWLTEDMLGNLLNHLSSAIPGLRRTIIAEKHGGWRVHEVAGDVGDVARALDALSKQRLLTPAMSLVQRDIRPDEFDPLIQMAIRLHKESGGCWNDTTRANFTENEYLWSLAVELDHNGNVQHFGQRFALFIGCPEMASWSDHALFHKAYQDYFSWRSTTFHQQLGRKTPLAQKIRARVSPPGSYTIDLEYLTVLLPFWDESGRPCLVNVASFRPLS